MAVNQKFQCINTKNLLKQNGISQKNTDKYYIFFINNL